MKFKIIRNVYIPYKNKLKKVDIIIKKDKFYSIEKPFCKKYKNYEEINATNLIALPGLIDAHTHFKLKLAENSYNSDDFKSGTMAAIAGGVTNIIDFTGQGRGITLNQGLKERLKDAKNSYCDYSFHCIIPSLNLLKNPKTQIDNLIKKGITSFKIFTAYKKRGLQLSENEIKELFKILKKNKAMATIHAEDEDLIEKNIKKYEKELLKLKIKALPLTRNFKTENSAINKILKTNKNINALIYFVHISSYKSILLLKKARKRMKVMGETCPHYIILNDKIYSYKNAHYYSFCPPTRTKKDNFKIINLLKENILQNIVTDSCAFTKKQKDLWENDIRKLYMGIASTELLLPLIYTYLVKNKKINLCMLKNLLSSNPAKTFGIPLKGEIKKDYYADLTIFDPNEKFKVKAKNLFHKTDFSPYENFTLWGRNKYTFLRGNLVYSNNKIIKNPKGKFIKRTLPKFF